jgi:hypothetical protein
MWPPATAPRAAHVQIWKHARHIKSLAADVALLQSWPGIPFTWLVVKVEVLGPIAGAWRPFARLHGERPTLKASSGHSRVTLRDHPRLLYNTTLLPLLILLRTTLHS